jgi:dUTP pyrophosphatase
MEIKIKKLYEDAKLPTRGTSESAGLDLYAYIKAGINEDLDEVVIEPHESYFTSTGIAMEIPSGTFGAIFARSGLACKQNLRPANCTAIIDSDYRGQLIVCLHNDSNEPRTIKDGDRIAQLIVMKYPQIEITEVDELSDTERGAGGFGHTGR